MDGSRGTDLCNIVREAGQPWGIGPGNPNPVESVESGLLSYSGDTDDVTNSFEVRLGKYVDLDLHNAVVGLQALRKIHAKGVERHQLGVVLVSINISVGDRVEVIRQGRRDHGAKSELPFF